MRAEKEAPGIWFCARVSLNPHPSTLNHRPSTISQLRFLPRSFSPGRDLVLSGFVLVVPLAELLFDLFCHQIDRGVKIAFDILGEEIGAWKGNPNGA